MEWWRGTSGARIAVLGPIALMVDGRLVGLRSGVQRLLLAALVARADQTVSSDALIEALWGDRLPAHPAAALQSQVSRLRARLAARDAIETVGTGYRLRGGPDHIDAACFEDRLGAAQADPSPLGALAAVEGALGLWRGPAYLEAAEHDAVRHEAARLEELRAGAEEDRAELLITLGRHDEAALGMQRVESAHPFRERCVALRAQALAKAGRQAEAVRALAGLRRRLGEELGLEPSPGLRALEADVLRHETVVAGIGLPGNTFVGRDEDLQAVTTALGSARLVTLVGPGGVGKTRLARHVANGSAGRYRDGVHFCELAAVTEPAAVAAAVGSGLPGGARPAGTALDRVLDFLRARQALLVIDNCEQVLGGVAELVELVLGQAPDVTVLATSRHRLGLPAETRLTVEPLWWEGQSPASSPAVQLFIDRAAAVRPGFSVTDPAVLAAVTALCRHLGGLPLAIELAAARCVARSPAEILDDLRHQPGAPAGGGRPDGRHQSMAAVVDWSYGLLTTGEQSLFRRLATFAGGFTAEAAAAVEDRGSGPGLALEHLVSLVEHSLVLVEELRGQSRYGLLEPVRQRAELTLRAAGEEAATRAGQAAWAVRWAESAELGLRGPDEAAWHARYEVELANLRAAHRWCLEHDPDGAVRLAACGWTAVWHGPAEVFGWADDTLARFGDRPHPQLPVVYAVAATGAWRRNDLERAGSLAARGTELAGSDDPAGRFAWEVLGDTRLHLGDVAQAVHCLERAHELAVRAGDDAHAAVIAVQRPLYLAHGAAPGQAGAAVPVERLPDNPTCRAFAAYVAGELRAPLAPGDALEVFGDGLEEARAAGSRFLAGILTTSALACSARVGDPANAMPGYAELIGRWHRAGAWNQQWTTILALIETLTQLGRDEPAAVLYGALTTSPSAVRIFGADAARVEAARAGLSERLGPERLDRLIARGARLGDKGTVDYALRCVVAGE